MPKEADYLSNQRGRISENDSPSDSDLSTRKNRAGATGGHRKAKRSGRKSRKGKRY